MPGSRSKFGNRIIVPSLYRWNISECAVKPQQQTNKAWKPPSPNSPRFGPSVCLFLPPFVLIYGLLYYQGYLKLMHRWTLKVLQKFVALIWFYKNRFYSIPFLPNGMCFTNVQILHFSTCPYNLLEVSVYHYSGYVTLNSFSSPETKLNLDPSVCMASTNTASDASSRFSMGFPVNPGSAGSRAVRYRSFDFFWDSTNCRIIPSRHF